MSQDINDIIKTSSIAVYRQLGFGLSECAYRKALSSELRIFFPDLQQEYHISQYYRTSQGIDIQIADLRFDIYIPSQKILIELKTLTRDIGKDSREYKQLFLYSKLIKPNYKYLINFGKSGLQIVDKLYYENHDQKNKT